MPLESLNTKQKDQEKNAKTFLEGFKGYLHTDADAYSGYGKVKDIHHYIPKRPPELMIIIKF